MEQILKYQGFTLIELVTVIMLTSIISFSFLPRLLEIKTFNEYILKKKIFNSLLYGQNLAINSGCHVLVNISNNLFSLKLRDACQTGDFNTNVTDPNNLKDNYLINMPSNINLNSENFPIYFDHNGQAKSINNNVVNANIIINCTKSQQTINIFGNNGIIE